MTAMRLMLIATIKCDYEYEIIDYEDELPISN